MVGHMGCRTGVGQWLDSSQIVIMGLDVRETDVAAVNSCNDGADVVRVTCCLLICCYESVRLFIVAVCLGRPW